jgi:apyrase
VGKFLFIILSFMVFYQCKSNNRASPQELSQSREKKFAVVIDAGSSGSRVYIYYWYPQHDGIPEVWPAPDLFQVAWSKKIEPGLATFKDPQKAADSLIPLLDYVKEKLSQNSAEPLENATHKIIIYLKATAGFRAIEESHAKTILEEVRKLISKEGFATAARENKGVEIIGGTDEGIYGFITLNYILRTLIGQKNNKRGLDDLYGSLDLGGASTQISFPTLNKGPNVKSFKLGKDIYNIYTHSFFGFGVDIARKKLASSDCYPKGYKDETVIGTGSYEGCQNKILEGMFSSKDLVPILPATKFYAFSGFYHAASFLKLAGPSSPEQFMQKGREFCSRDWDELNQEYSKHRFLNRFCFYSAFIPALLSGQKITNAPKGYSFEIDDGSRIIFDDKITSSDVGTHEIGWQLGSMIFEITGDKL